MLQAQAYQKKYANTRRRDVEYAVGDKVLLSTKNLRLHGTRKFRDRYVGLFVVLEHIGKAAYRLDLSSRAALRGFHNVFHVLLLRDWLSNGVHANVPPIEIDGEVEYEVASIKGHHERSGEMQYSTSFVGFDSSGDMWLTTAQLDHAP